MRADTRIHIAIRNVGDSQDTGQHFEGTTKESLLWLMQQIAKISIADRIAIGIGRDKSGAMKGIQLARGATANELATEGILDAIFNGANNGASEDAPQQATLAEVNPLDDYQG